MRRSPVRSFRNLTVGLAAAAALAGCAYNGAYITPGFVKPSEGGAAADVEAVHGPALLGAGEPKAGNLDLSNQNAAPAKPFVRPAAPAASAPGTI